MSLLPPILVDARRSAHKLMHYELGWMGASEALGQADDASCTNIEATRSHQHRTYASYALPAYHTYRAS